ncbi:hypothetical protein [Streptosporangium sp. KLBMP 9127]|nr:hypothetical protein [Streptosporangium sp. KLBMP 9127]
MGEVQAALNNSPLADVGWTVWVEVVAAVASLAAVLLAVITIRVTARQAAETQEAMRLGTVS